jgi:hypothetical protein
MANAGFWFQKGALRQMIMSCADEKQKLRGK